MKKRSILIFFGTVTRPTMKVKRKKIFQDKRAQISAMMMAHEVDDINKRESEREYDQWNQSGYAGHQQMRTEVTKIMSVAGDNVSFAFKS